MGGKPCVIEGPLPTNSNDLCANPTNAGICSDTGDCVPSNTDGLTCSTDLLHFSPALGVCATVGTCSFGACEPFSPLCRDVE